MAKEYLGRSRLFRRLKNGAHGEADYILRIVGENIVPMAQAG
jgi:hypothetical protein